MSANVNKVIRRERNKAIMLKANEMTMSNLKMSQ